MGVLFFFFPAVFLNFRRARAYDIFEQQEVCRRLTHSRLRKKKPCFEAKLLKRLIILNNCVIAECRQIYNILKIFFGYKVSYLLTRERVYI